MRSWGQFIILLRLWRMMILRVLFFLFFFFFLFVDGGILDYAEADAFWCFTQIMSEVMDNFCKSLDKSQSGIVRKMRELNLLLKEKDRQLWQNLVIPLLSSLSDCIDGLRKGGEEIESTVLFLSLDYAIVEPGIRVT